MTAWQALRFAGELIIDLVREARQERAAARTRKAALAPKRAEASRRYQQASNAAGSVQCNRAPEGWRCTRAYWHDGLCVVERVVH